MTRQELIDIFRTGDIEWYVKSHFLHSTKEILHLPIRTRAFDKFLSAEKEYGEFHIDQNWMEEMRQEIEDGVFYKFLDMHRLKLILAKQYPVVQWKDMGMYMLPDGGEIEPIRPPAA